MPQYFSQEGLEKIKKELQERKGPTRAEINKRILAAKELGDLSENAEYIEAREAQSLNEGRIVELEEILREAVIIDAGQHKDLVTVGSTIKVKSIYGEQQFSIVGPSEADPIRGFISNESPLGSAFLSHKKGDEIEVKTPKGLIKYLILNIL